MNNKYNWDLIQKYYDDGMSCRDIMKEFGIAKNTLVYAKRRGCFKTRSRSDAMKLDYKKKPRTLSEETKKKISKSRKKFLDENPHMVPYLLNHSSKMSYPEKLSKIFSKKKI